MFRIHETNKSYFRVSNCRNKHLFIIGLYMYYLPQITLIKFNTPGNFGHVKYLWSAP